MRLGHAVVTAKAPWGRSDSADVFVVGDAVVASNRSGAYGLYQFRGAAGDTLVPLLVDGATNVQAVYSPDRTRLVFSSNRGGSYDLFVVDADGKNLSRITSDPGNESEPRWTPDGSRIVYTLTPAGGLPQIRSVGTAGQDDRLVTGPPHGNQSPALSHDGRQLAFVSNRDGNQEIYLADLPSGVPRRLTRTKERESNPRFLPDGTLVYVMEGSGRAKGSRIMRLAPGAAEPTPLLVTEYPIHSLDVSADGSRAIYVVGQPRKLKGPDGVQDVHSAARRRGGRGDHSPRGGAGRESRLLRALTLTALGGPEQLAVRELPAPEIRAPGDVLVRIRMAALNRLDLWMTAGLPNVSPQFPFVVGSDGAGVVEAVGPGVQSVRPGDRVMINPGLSCGHCCRVPRRRRAALPRVSHPRRASARHRRGARRGAGGESRGCSGGHGLAGGGRFQPRRR